MTSIFLSYARGDDEGFVRKLYHDLSARGFDVWFDRVCMPSRQLTFYQEIRDAIAARDRLLLVVGPRAVDSEYVEQEWRRALEMGICVNPIVRLDGRREDGHRVDGYELLPEELKLVHAEDFRDDARYEEHLSNLARQLSDPAPPLGKLVAVPTLPPHYRSRRERLRELRDALLIDLRSPVNIAGAAARIGVQGMGGIGKSVLACAIARDIEVRRAFPGGVFWIAVGQQPDTVDLQRRLGRELGHDGPIDDIHTGRQLLRDLLSKRTVLLILDDVWRRADAEAFDVLGPNGRLLMTTRDAGLVSSLTRTEYQVQPPTEAEATAVLAGAARLETEAMPAAAKAIVEGCGRLPLALSLCGGMIQAGVPWQDVVEALREHDLRFIRDEHAAETQHVSVWRAIEMSVQVLPEETQRRFVELAVFPEDVRAPESAVLTLWSHTGGLTERDARRLLVDLKQRSLISLERKDDATAHVLLHDLLHGYAVVRAEQEFGGRPNVHRNLVEGYRKRCRDGWASCPDDGYIRKYLPVHLAEAEAWEELLGLIPRPELAYLSRWIEQGEGEVGAACLTRLIQTLEARRERPVVMAGLATQLARIHTLYGRYEDARRCLMTYTLPHTNWFRGRRIRAVALHELGSLHLYEESYEVAASYYRNAYRLCRLGLLDMRDEASANLIGLATVAKSQIRYRKAVRLARAALRLARLAGDARHEVAALRLLGAIHGYLGNYPRAERILRDAVALAQSRSVWLEMPRLKLLQGWLAYDLARLRGTPLTDALGYFDGALEEATRHYNLYCILETKMSLGWCALARGRTDEAATLLGEVVQAAPAGMFKALDAAAQIGLACVRQQRGEINDALHAYERTARLCREQRFFTWESTARIGLGALHWHYGNREIAESIWQEALRAARTISAAAERLAHISIDSCKTAPDTAP